MKELFFCLSFYLISNSLVLPATAATRPNFIIITGSSAWAKGAASPNELAQNVLQAIKENKTESLNAFLLGEAEFVQLKNKSSADMKAFLDNTTVTDLQNTFRTSYDNLIKDGISQTINWSEMEVSEARLGKAAPKTPFLLPVTVTLLDKQQRPLLLLLETVKLNNRYFLFRKIDLQPRQ